MRSPDDLDEQVWDMANKMDDDITRRVADQLARSTATIASR